MPSAKSSQSSSSATGCAAKNAGGTRRVVASSATAFAPFSQNSAVCRRCAGSGHAHPMQSKPVTWFTFRRVFAVRAGPIWSSAISIEWSTAGAPTARFFGFVTVSLDSSMFASARSVASAMSGSVPATALGRVRASYVRDLVQDPVAGSDV